MQARSVSKLVKELRDRMALTQEQLAREVGVTFSTINHYVRQRLMTHLRRRSQRSYKPPEGRTYYEQLSRLGLTYLKHKI